jgi:hypothetical protein
MPEGSHFCLKCGRSVHPPTLSAGPVMAQGSGQNSVVRVVSPGRVVPLLLVALVAALLWAGTSESSTAQRIQEFVRWSHEQTILDTPVAVGPHSFSATKFTVPAGALNASVAGDFGVAADVVSKNPGSRNPDGKDGDRGPEKLDSGVEAYVLTDAAFAVWSSGYSTPSLYESGLNSGAAINASLPAGAGVYHLVFSNKASPRAKSVHATVLLRYKSWMPDTVTGLKDRFWNWIG